MLNRISDEDIEEKIKFHIKHGIPYTLEITGTRKIFKSKRGGYISRESKFLARELHFIKAVKEHIIKDEIYLRVKNNFKKEKDKEKIDYYKYNSKYKSGDILNGGYEIDLKQAYWETTNKMGMLTPELYRKGMEVSKLARLASVGTLAKKSRLIVFDGIEEKNMGVTRSEKTEFLWDTICYKVGRIMHKASNIDKDGFIFFWVDGIFISKDSSVKEEIMQLFRDLGYKSSVTKFDSILFYDKKIIVKSKEKRKRVTIDGVRKWTDERPFPFNKK